MDGRGERESERWRDGEGEIDGEGDEEKARERNGLVVVVVETLLKTGQRSIKNKK